MIIRVFLFALAVFPSLQAGLIGQVDTFGNGTTLGWLVGPTSPNPPANMPGGGPAGPGDPYLFLLSTGFAGPGGRLSVLNGSQWAGDYRDIPFLSMDVNNFGPSELHLRLLFEDFDPVVPGAPVNLALSADPIIVPAGSGWRTIQFPIDPAHLVVDTFGTVAGALMSTDTLRIFHNPAPAFPGPGIGIPMVNAALGVDNITAVVPEPGTLPLFLGGLAAFLAWRLRRAASRRP